VFLQSLSLGVESFIHAFLAITSNVAQLASMQPLQDLLDYLSQLLGTEGTEVKGFVDDVGRFQQGEALLLRETVPAKLEVPSGARQLQENYMDSKPPAVKQPPKKPPPAPKKQAAGGVKKQPATKKIAQQKLPAILPNKTEPVAVQPPPPLAEKMEEQPIKKYHPPKGKASIVCGCFGTLHKPLTNCLYCGRISCEREGYDFCGFCGMFVEEAKSSNDAATQHKERLLRFDRDFARRTVVLDDQADYFSNQTSTWLTQEEQADAKQIETDRQNELHTRKKQTLDIAF
jgi:hypothetical protein